MEALVQRIRQEGRHLGNGILKVDSFLNHQLDPNLTTQMGHAFKDAFTRQRIEGITKIITAEVSGIAPALATGAVFGVPVVYARKKRPITMPSGAFETEAPSHTKGGITKLIISPEYLHPTDKVLLIDDFLASGQTILALAGLIKQCGAQLLGIGCVIEKSFEGGRTLLEPLGVPIVTLAVIDHMTETEIIVRDAPVAESR